MFAGYPRDIASKSVSKPVLGLGDVLELGRRRTKPGHVRMRTDVNRAHRARLGPVDEIMQIVAEKSPQGARQLFGPRNLHLPTGMRAMPVPLAGDIAARPRARGGASARPGAMVRARTMAPRGLAFARASAAPSLAISPGVGIPSSSVTTAPARTAPQ